MTKLKRQRAANSLDINQVVTLVFQTNDALNKNFSFLTVQKTFELSIVVAGFILLKQCIEDTFENVENM